ncbi:hypothetical protein R0L47_08415 [Pectobacterium polonicum]|uniref:hypothetical protein n=1 Tax=Pectobacterium polonicum TaxID=2485124 RepID=UPI0010F7D532|nr:hypothetical protein [Pectobacterium polonicum]
MEKITFTKFAIYAVRPQDMRDTVAALLPMQDHLDDYKVFVLKYCTNSGECHKPALCLYGELTGDQACTRAQEWLNEARKGGPLSGKA